MSWHMLQGALPIHHWINLCIVRWLYFWRYCHSASTWWTSGLSLTFSMSVHAWKPSSGCTSLSTIKKFSEWCRSLKSHSSVTRPLVWILLPPYATRLGGSPQLVRCSPCVTLSNVWRDNTLHFAPMSTLNSMKAELVWMVASSCFVSTFGVMLSTSKHRKCHLQLTVQWQLHVLAVCMSYRDFEVCFCSSFCNG